ncbi:MAG: hypothetical protein JWR20_1404 [Marmoricola sp.]|nr:hypothetical protein [Marmoricola sp.]
MDTLAERSAAESHHYRHFLAGPRAGAEPHDGRPLLLALGNCQAESLRLLLDAGDVRTVQVPALHDLRPAEVPVLQQWLARTDLLVAPPVAPDYRGLPLGTDQLVGQLPASARTCRVPLVRYAGLHPWHLVVHPPGLPDPQPPVVAYHDVRVVAAAAWARAGRPAPGSTPAGADGVLAVAHASVAELARRERAAGTVVLSDLLAAPSTDAMRTVNHPGNELLVPLAARVRADLGLPALGPAVTRPLLTSVLAPVEPVVLAAHGLADDPRPDWVLDGTRVPVTTVAEAQRAFYAARPDVLDVCLERAREPAAALAVALPDPAGAGSRVTDRA